MSLNKAGNQILFGFKCEFWPFASLGWYCIAMRAAFIFWSNLCFHKQERQRFEFLPLWSISQIKFGFWTWSLRAEMNSNIIAISSCEQLEFEFWTWSLGSEINSNIIAALSCGRFEFESRSMLEIVNPGLEMWMRTLQMDQVVELQPPQRGRVKI